MKHRYSFYAVTEYDLWLVVVAEILISLSHDVLTMVDYFDLSIDQLNLLEQSQNVQRTRSDSVQMNLLRTGRGERFGPESSWMNGVNRLSKSWMWLEMAEIDGPGLSVAGWRLMVGLVGGGIDLLLTENRITHAVTRFSPRVTFVRFFFLLLLHTVLDCVIARALLVRRMMMMIKMKTLVVAQRWKPWRISDQISFVRAQVLFNWIA